MVIDSTQQFLEKLEELLTDEGYDVVLNAVGIQDGAEVERVQPSPYRTRMCSPSVDPVPY